MSMYSFPTIFFTNFGGTEPKPAIIGRSAGEGWATPDVDGAVTAAGHGIAGAGAPVNYYQLFGGGSQLLV